MCERKKNKEDEGFFVPGGGGRLPRTSRTDVALRCVVLCMHGIAVRINQLSKMREEEGRRE